MSPHYFFFKKWAIGKKSKTYSCEATAKPKFVRCIRNTSYEMKCHGFCVILRSAATSHSQELFTSRRFANFARRKLCMALLSDTSYEIKVHGFSDIVRYVGVLRPWRTFPFLSGALPHEYHGTCLLAPTGTANTAHSTASLSTCLLAPIGTANTAYVMGRNLKKKDSLWEPHPHLFEFHKNSHVEDGTLDCSILFRWNLLKSSVMLIRFLCRTLCIFAKEHKQTQM